MGSWKKIIIISIPLSIVLVCMIIFLIYPTVRDISKSSKDLFDLKKESYLYKDGADRMGSLKESRAKIESIENKVDNLFVDAKIPINLIEFWEKTAKGANILIDISPISLKTSGENSWNPVGFQIIATGSYSNFMKFLVKLENSPYLTSIDNLTLKNLNENEVAAENSKKITISDVRGILDIRVFSKK